MDCAQSLPINAQHKRLHFALSHHASTLLDSTSPNISSTALPVVWSATVGADCELGGADYHVCFFTFIWCQQLHSSCRTAAATNVMFLSASIFSNASPFAHTTHALCVVHLMRQMMDATFPGKE